MYWASSRNSIQVTNFCRSASGMPRISDKVKMGSCCEKAVTKLQSSLVLIASSKSVTLALTLILKLDT